MAAVDPLLIELPEQLIGPRIIIRPYADSDAPALWAAVDESREHIGEWMPWAAEYTAPDHALMLVRRFRAWWQLRQDLVVGIFERDTGRLLGGTGMRNIDWTIRRFEVGYWLRRSDVGRGFATEAVQVLTRCCFFDLQANRVEIRMDARNIRSRNVPERLGFVYEGCYRQALPDAHGQPRDVDTFSLVRSDLPGVTWLHQSDGGPAQASHSDA